MEDKRLLNNEELEKAIGGIDLPRRNDRYSLYCANCKMYVKKGIHRDLVEEEKELYESIHKCAGGQEPCLIIEPYR